MPEEYTTYTTLRIKTTTKLRLNKAKHELYKDSFDDAINTLIDEHEHEKQ